MRELKTNLTTSGKGSTNIQPRRGKSFGYQVLGFGSGGGVAPYEATYLVIAGGGGGGHNNGGGAGGGGFLTNFGGSAITLTGAETYTITVGAGGASGGTTGAGTVGDDSVLSGAGISTVTSDGGGFGSGSGWLANLFGAMG